MPDSIQLEQLAMPGLMAYAPRLWWRLNRRRMKGWLQRVKDHLPIHRHPKSPKDCLHCCRGLHLEKVHIKRDVRPWEEMKRQRGRKKRYATQGCACLNPACPYCGITDETIYTLVSRSRSARLAISVWRAPNYLTLPFPVPVYGYRPITALLKRVHWRVNHKRVYCIWRQEGVQLPRRKVCKRRAGSSRLPYDWMRSKYWLSKSRSSTLVITSASAPSTTTASSWLASKPLLDKLDEPTSATLRSIAMTLA
jgi:hypothetical protein